MVGWLVPDSCRTIRLRSARPTFNSRVSVSGKGAPARYDAARPASETGTSRRYSAMSARFCSLLPVEARRWHKSANWANVAAMTNLRCGTPGFACESTLGIANISTNQQFRYEIHWFLSPTPRNEGEIPQFQ